jgi:hypothetical protein
VSAPQDVPGRRPAPVVLPGGAGLFVPGETAAELAAALDLLGRYIAGVMPPASVRVPSMSPTMGRLLKASMDAAVEYRRSQSQRPYAAASAPPVPVLTPAIADASSSKEITCGAAATITGLSEARIRQLATAGTIQGRKTDRSVWLLDPVSVRAYAARPRTRSSTGADHHTDRTARPGTPGS